MLPPRIVWLRTVWGLEGQARYLYSINGRTWTDAGIVYPLQWAYYRGDRIGLFTYNDLAAEGSATFTQFHYRCTDEVAAQRRF